MALPRNVYDPQKKSRNLVTTIFGVIVSSLSILVLLNVISFEQSTQLQGYAITTQEAITALIGVISGVISLFKATD